ncbi:MAG TPA: glycosyltransferase family 39 protein [Stellaceae bacterium]|nr:glycosyltransferase family 39 protein [Stellaceae bacterium]
MVSPSTADAGWRGAKSAKGWLRLACRLAPYVAIVVAGSVLLATSPFDGDFAWSDAPRHALNGAFLKDLIAALPRHPVTWAESYYLQYPSLSILFYPPLFYVFEAVAFAVLGVTQFAAQATVVLFYVLLGLGLYRLTRLWASRPAALGAALMLMGMPEVALWGRQVMLDIPAMAWLVWGIYAFARFLKFDRGRDLALAAVLLLAALYTKYNVAFVVAALLLTLIAARGRSLLRGRRLWWTAAAAAVGALPAIGLLFTFGSANLQSAADLSGELPRWSFAAWSFYPVLLPQIVGWPVLGLAVAGLVAFVAGRIPALKGWPAWLLLGWTFIGYAFFTAIAVREPRHLMTALPPLAVLAACALDRLLPRRIGGIVALAVGAGVFAWTVAYDPVPTVIGYKHLADYVADGVPANARVLFSGYRDGNFVFDLRMREDRRDISTIRADKLLLRIAIERRRGVGEADYSQAQIAALIRTLGIDLVVAQDGFWADLTEMHRLADVLAGPDFTPVAHFTIGGTMGRTDRSFTIYRPNYPVEQKTRTLELDMPIFGGRIGGQLR